MRYPDYWKQYRGHDELAVSLRPNRGWIRSTRLLYSDVGPVCLRRRLEVIARNRSRFYSTAAPASGSRSNERGTFLEVKALLRARTKDVRSHLETVAKSTN